MPRPFKRLGIFERPGVWRQPAHLPAKKVKKPGFCGKRFAQTRCSLGINQGVIGFLLSRRVGVGYCRKTAGKEGGLSKGKPGQRLSNFSKSRFFRKYAPPIFPRDISHLTPYLKKFTMISVRIEHKPSSYSACFICSFFNNTFNRFF